MRAERSRETASPEVGSRRRVQNVAGQGIRAPDDTATEREQNSLIDRVRARCERRPMLCSMLVGARVVEEGGDRVVLEFTAGQRAAAAVHIEEFRPFFEDAIGRKGIELVVAGVEEAAGSRADEAAARTASAPRVDVDMKHPLIEGVINEFDAVAKHVEKREGGSS